MSQENIKIDQSSSEAKNPSERFSMLKKRGKKIVVGATVIGMLIGYTGHDTVDSIVDGAQKLISEGPTIEQSGEQASNLITVVAESGDSVITLCQENMAYNENNEPNWQKVAYSVKNRPENEAIFENGRVLQVGDKLRIDAIWDESADK